VHEVNNYINAAVLVARVFQDKLGKWEFLGEHASLLDLKIAYFQQ